MFKFLRFVAFVVVFTTSGMCFIDLIKTPVQPFAYVYELRLNSDPIDRNNLIAQLQNSMAWAATLDSPASHGFEGVVPGMAGSVKVYWRGEVSYWAAAFLEQYSNVQVDIVSADYSLFELHKVAKQLANHGDLLERYQIMNITENSDGSGLAIHTFLDRDSPESATIVRAFKVLTMVPLSFVFSDRNFSQMDIRSV